MTPVQNYYSNDLGQELAAGTMSECRVLRGGTTAVHTDTLREGHESSPSQLLNILILTQLLTFSTFKHSHP